MVAMIDRSPWGFRAQDIWGKFCPDETLGKIPKRVYGVFDRIDEPVIRGDFPDRLVIGNPNRCIYICEGDGSVMRSGIDSPEFINSDVNKFIWSLETFAQFYPYYTDDTEIESIRRKEGEIKKALVSIDKAVSRDTDFWFGLLEDFESYGEFSTEFLFDEYGVDAATD